MDNFWHFYSHPRGLKSKKKNQKGEGKWPKRETALLATRSSKQANKTKHNKPNQTKPKVLAAGKPDSIVELFPPSFQTQLKLF